MDGWMDGWVWVEVRVEVVLQDLSVSINPPCGPADRVCYYSCTEGQQPEREHSWQVTTTTTSTTMTPPWLHHDSTMTPPHSVNTSKRVCRRRGSCSQTCCSSIVCPIDTFTLVRYSEMSAIVAVFFVSEDAAAPRDAAPPHDQTRKWSACLRHVHGDLM